MSKGSGRRPAAVSAVEAERNWARTFGNADSERCKVFQPITDENRGEHEPIRIERAA